MLFPIATASAESPRAGLGHAKREMAKLIGGKRGSLMKPLTAVSTELVRPVGDRAELERPLCFVKSASTDFGGNGRSAAAVFPRNRT